MDNKLSVVKRYIVYAFSGIALAMGSGCFVEAASINEFAIVPPNPMSDDLVQVTIKGYWSSGDVSCIPGEPDISINGKNIQVHYTTPSNPSTCIRLYRKPDKISLSAFAIKN
jgi:hypothetical protein